MRATEPYHRLSLRAKLTLWVTLGAIAILALMAGWVVAVLRPGLPGDAGFGAHQRDIVAAGALLAALAGACIWWLAGRLLAPLQQLEQAIHAHPDRPTPADARSAAHSRELAAVVKAYNDLMQREHAAEAALARSERQLRAVTDNVPALISYIDSDQVYRSANAYYRVVFGIEPDSLVGQTVQQALGETLYQAVRGRVAAALAGEPQCFESSVTWRGRNTHLQIHYVPSAADDGTVDGFYVMTLDVTERTRSERLLADNERMLRAVTDNLPVLITYIDSDERLRFANATFSQWLGIDVQASLGRPVRDVIGPAHHGPRYALLQRALAGKRVEFDSEAESEGVHRHLQTVYIPDRRPDGSVAGIYTLTTDVSATKQVQRQLDELARVDVLTGLPNRRQFDEKLPEALARCRRDQRALALMYVDLDQFKRINDSLGHAAGDAVLREFAARLRANVRSTDLAARLAGDEFVVLLEGVPSQAEAERLAQKIVEATRAEFRFAGAPLQVTTSLGIGFAARPDVSAEALVVSADAALYTAKRAGRNGWCLQPCVAPAAVA
jgi:diguanylate cyclase (GGDEF)-like protein/PAS domain S-box-containing protein